MKINIKIYYRNVDTFLILFLAEPYQKISNYLIDKFFSYSIRKDVFSSNQNIKIISIDCIDYIHNNKYCIKSLRTIFKNKNYIFYLDIDKPDYIIYNVFGCQHKNKKYNNAIKIAFYSENSIPDFDEADYALSQAHYIYFDRYFKYPVFINKLEFLTKRYNLDKIREKVLKNPLRRKFCAAVISNNKSYTYFRLEFIKQLNKYKKIDMGGSAFNNIGKAVKNKIKFLSLYKFSISMENSDGDGYASEKIIESFTAGTIPIYYGDYMIDEYINPKAYILIKGEKDMKKKIEYIKRIDNDDELYKAILREKLLSNNFNLDKFEEEKRNFFYNIFEQNKNFSKRKDIDNINLKCKNII